MTSSYWSIHIYFLLLTHLMYISHMKSQKKRTMKEEALKKIKSRQKSIVDLIYYFLNSKLFTRFNGFYSYDNEKLLGCSGIMLNIADVSFVLLQQEWMEEKNLNLIFPCFFFYLFPSRSSCIFRYVTMCNNGISNTAFYY